MQKFEKIILVYIIIIVIVIGLVSYFNVLYDPSLFITALLASLTAAIVYDISKKYLNYEIKMYNSRLE